MKIFLILSALLSNCCLSCDTGLFSLFYGSKIYSYKLYSLRTFESSIEWKKIVKAAKMEFSNITGVSQDSCEVIEISKIKNHDEWWLVTVSEYSDLVNLQRPLISLRIPVSSVGILAQRKATGSGKAEGVSP